MIIGETDKQLIAPESETLIERVMKLEAENARLRQEREELKRGEDQLRMLLDNARDIVFQLSPRGVIEYVSPKTKEIYGYEPAELIGQLFEKTTPLSELPKAIKALTRALSGETIAGLEIGQLDAVGKIVIVEINGAPITRDGKVIAVQGVMRDITARKKAEDAAREGTRKLIKAMEDTMQSMAMVVEMRDPFTAGHQRRVAQLACVIAEEMGLTTDRVTGLRLAGLIHDIGKVRVPAEILTNPKKLSDAEMTIIKTHPTLGYEVLKSLDLPWPIAMIVHQHHERMNGSGYPLQLAGKDIILEARILAVADVVEAIASHRPYRPARGIGEALDEVSKQKNQLYDAEVVDACIKLFKERGYKLQ
jgi:PAS domain S-box-containing protein/putative nucleotidyltransferase with HDIG domain